jgi:hypothetical protein
MEKQLYSQSQADPEYKAGMYIYNPRLKKSLPWKPVARFELIGHWGTILPSFLCLIAELRYYALRSCTLFLLLR